MVNEWLNDRRFLWALLPCAVVLCLAAWLRGAEYDEQYTLFLTAGVPRPDWPLTVFPAGLARDLQSGTTSFVAIARDLRITDVHPPLYFWLVSLWRATLGPDLFTARLLSVALGLGGLALVGSIARVVRIPPMWAMLLTLGCYGFTYTSVIARGFALAQILLLGGVLCVLSGRRIWHFVVAGMLFGAATLSNYLAMFTVGACLLAVGLEVIGPRRPAPDGLPASRRALSVLCGFLIFIPWDLWWFLAQRGSRQGQFAPFSLLQSLARLAVKFSGDILGGLPLYVDGAATVVVSAALGMLLVWLLARVVWRWRHIGIGRARIMFGLGALAPPCGLLLLGAMFNNTPIEIRYLTFSTPFVGLLLAGALGTRGRPLLLAVQAASIAGLMLASQTMQPARAAARVTAAMTNGNVVLLPRGNDGVGVVGAFAIEAPAELPLLLIRASDQSEQIRARIQGWPRVTLALLDQDAASHAACEAMRQALLEPGWREVAHRSNVAVYERVGERE